MRLIVILISMAFVTAGCSSSEEHLNHIHLDVSGMTCEGCENAVVASINKLDGIQEASASHTNAEATIVFDTTLTSIHDIAHSIEDAGYSVDGEPAQHNH